MLRIYCGGETCQKEKFIFDSINPEQNTIIIVPDQFSLQIERDVLKYFEKKTGQTSLFNVMVADFSSLGHKVVKEHGGNPPELIDKYGRHMLLSMLIAKLANTGSFDVYENMKGKNSFAAHVNQMISEMKRYGVTPSDLDCAIDNTDSFLQLKLEDIKKIYNEYEDAIDGRFTDSEDYIRLYGEFMEKSRLIKNADIWIYGFDTFSPLNMEVMQKLLETAKAMNIVLTREDKTAFDARILTIGDGEGLFDLTGRVIANLKEMAAKSDVDIEIKKIPSEKNLHRESIWDENITDKITLAKATNIYEEADRVAAHVMKLVREDGYRFGDITIVCNDMDVRGGVLKRTFDRWEIPAFTDRKRKVLHQPVVRFLLSFMDVIASGYDNNAVMEMISAGLMGWNRSDEELLINYVNEAKVKGSGWKKEFIWRGKHDYGARYTDEDLVKLNEMRGIIIRTTEAAKDEIGRRNTAREKITGLYNFLENDFEIRRKIEDLINRQLKCNLMEGAEETAQSWKIICNLFSQVLRVIGDDNISNSQLKEILEAGLKETEIGIVPTNNDCVLIGTLQRTRISKTRSLIVTAANEGILPLQSSEGGLLTERELDVLEELKLNISKREEVRRQEEQLAIYRMFSLPEEDLFVTCSLADQEGKSALPSEIFVTLSEIGGVQVLGDLGSKDIMEKFASRKGTLPYLAISMQNFIENGKIQSEWLAAMNWYAKNDDKSMTKLQQGLRFDNQIEALGNDLADSLYFGSSDEIYVSASRLELYGKCPFKHFLRYGLRADEEQRFEIDGRIRGDVYHDVLQLLSKRLTNQDISITDEKSRWMTVSEEECRKEIEEILLEKTADYREGIYISNRENELQLQRIIETCGDVAWAMIEQVRKSKTKKMFFEEPFGHRGDLLKPLQIELGGGKRAMLVGRIDRIDILDASGESVESASEAVRVIDYKTGSDKINMDHIREGYKLQLMLYMNAAEEFARPAGVFYFKIGDMDEKLQPGKVPKPLAERRSTACRLEGIMVDDGSIINAMDETLQPGEASTVIPIKINKNGEQKNYSPSAVLSKEEFKNLCEETFEHAKRICEEIQNGHVDIAPKIEAGSTPSGGALTSCTYCGYKSICMFDTSFKQCRFTKV